MKVHAVRLALSAVAVVATSLVVWALTPIAPDVSLGVLYTLPVLGVAMVWGLGYAIGVSIASLLAFNFFFLPPVHTLSLSHAADWTALVVYLVTAVVTSQLAAAARNRAAEAERREHEAAVLADLAAELLERGSVDADRWSAELDMASSRMRAAVDALLALADERTRLQAEALEAEALRRTDAVKTAVIRAVSHDLRTPLATIHAAVDGLRNDDLDLDDADRAALLETVAVELARLEGFVENLLDLSRIQAGAAAPSPELWSADELVSRALAEVDGSRVELDVPPDLPPVRADGAQVERALVNLMGNALGFSPPGSPVIVRARVREDEVELRVEDLGPGVAPGEESAVFEPFRRSPESRGAGLGLAIARGFAEANGGSVRYEARPGGGAAFVLTLAAAELRAVVPR